MERKSAWFFLFASTRRREWAAGQITFLRLIRKVPKKFFNSFADIRMFKIYYTLMNRIYICRNCHKSCVAVIFTQHFPIPILQCLGNKLRLSFWLSWCPSEDILWYQPMQKYKQNCSIVEILRTCGFFRQFLIGMGKSIITQKIFFH